METENSILTLAISRHEMAISFRKKANLRHEKGFSRHEIEYSQQEMTISFLKKENLQHEKPFSRHEIGNSRHEIAISNKEEEAFHPIRNTC